MYKIKTYYQIDSHMRNLPAISAKYAWNMGKSELEDSISDGINDSESIDNQEIDLSEINADEMFRTRN